MRTSDLTMNEAADSSLFEDTESATAAEWHGTSSRNAQ